MKKFDLKCDNPKCNWKTNENPLKWYNKQCPECTNCIIITDKDMKIMEGAVELEKLGIFRLITSKDVIKSKQKGIIIKVDTSGLR